MDRPRYPLYNYHQLLKKNGLLTDQHAVPSGLEQMVLEVTCDSRAVIPGSLFICKGASFKEEYLAEAIRRGAFAYVSEQCYEQPATCIQVTNIRTAMGLLADYAWDHPSGKLKVIGSTGTKGKTTASYFLKSILDLWREAQGCRPVGILSTIITDDGLKCSPSALTTPEPLDLQRLLWNAANAGCGYLVMEESSQALKYDRVLGVELEVAMFLNIGEDHISPCEHPTLRDYFESKLKIFNQARIAVVNLDSDMCNRVLSAARKCDRVITYSLQNPAADLLGQGLTRNENGLSFTVKYRGEMLTCEIPMTGFFNVSNALAAMSVCEALEVPEKFVRAGLARTLVPGRMETYVSGQKTVIVDYAHNGMSLSALLRSVRHDYPGAEITAVFGCTGGKALDRRKGMGLAAAEYAHRIILTEDDPGPEEIADICADIGKHITDFGKTYQVIPDREQAISYAIQSAAAHSVVILAGKGSERQQKRKNGPEPSTPDSLLARKYLKRYPVVSK